MMGTQKEQLINGIKDTTMTSKIIKELMTIKKQVTLQMMRPCYGLNK